MGNVALKLDYLSQELEIKLESTFKLLIFSAQLFSQLAPLLLISPLNPGGMGGSASREAESSREFFTWSFCFSGF